ncbi:hypothetical protein ACODNH_02375 (plasmid) [Haloarcula sp. NS06]|jgi:hypothetical protein|uniref:Uncharacterized protein n=1 Tax=Halogeometricum luteum TaxID=2950537 RepID=A0ABU2G7S9_9EURY|nr:MULTISPECIES: hypothetical protein [Haloferacales]MDS0296846.1 hypothetical protein [Halogeometricum sp. S3BR5-2]
MAGLKKGTGSLDFDEESDEEPEETDETEASESEREERAAETETQPDAPTESDPTTKPPSSEEMPQEETQSQAVTPSQSGDFDLDDLPYLVQRQMRGASVNADRTKQLLLEVRPFVKEGEEDFLNDLQDLVDGPVYKGDAREAAMVVAQEHPELVAETLREWGIEYLDK